MSDEPPRTLSKTLHVITAHAPKPRIRVAPAADPPRVVVYEGHAFEVMFDGVDRFVVVAD